MAESTGARERAEGNAVSDFKRCRHFRAPYHNPTCLAGVNYRELSGEPELGWMARLPCVTTRLSKNQITCNYFDLETAEEHETKLDEMRARARSIMAAMKACREAKSSSGTVECPECKGKLHFSIASSNGHLWGRCEKDGCLSWMQ
jgi:hypothetical protein